MKVINIAEKFEAVREHWSPKVLGELNGQHVRAAKLKGEFVWHKHENEDELFLVVSGTLRIRTREAEFTIDPGEFLIVPRGVEHLPMADEEVHVLLLEPATTINTGNVESERTIRDYEQI